LGGCRGFQFVGHPLPQLRKTIIKFPQQKARLADGEAPLEIAAEHLVIEQTVKNRRLPDLLFNSSLDARNPQIIIN